jgi:hypothetical protein
MPRLNTTCIVQINSPYDQNGISAAGVSCHILDQSWLVLTAKSQTYIMKLAHADLLSVLKYF